MPPDSQPSRGPGSPLSRWLESHPAALMLAATLAAFGAYSCMYAFRKPLAAATFSGIRVGGLDFKVLVVLSQLVGYTLSKFLGIKVVSEVPAPRRAAVILGLIAIAEAALVLFGAIPAPWNALCLLLNGLPLGMIWGIVFGFLEGRRVSDLMGLGLSISFIVSSGVMKSVGRFTLEHWGVSEFWMPALSGALFLPLLGICLWVLANIPPPSAEDVAARARREPMNAERRRAFLREFGLGLAPLVLAYVLLSAYRDLRDTFMVEILKDLKALPDSSVFARIELLVGLGVLVLLAFFWNLRDNRRAVVTYQVIIAIGAVAVAVSTWAFQKGWIAPFWWMFWTGLGGYLAYVPYNSVLFERLLAAFRQSGTSAFLITLADAFGYAATATLYLSRTLFKAGTTWTSLLTTGSYVLAVSVPCLLIVSATVLLRKPTGAPSSAGH